MRALVGVDGTALGESAVRLVAALRFEPIEVVLLHCVESVLPDGSFPGAASEHPVADMLREDEQEGQEALDQASAILATANVSTTQRLERGSAHRVTLDVADELDPDLIAIGSEPKTAWGCLFFGSVTRAIVTGSQRTLLVAKKTPPENRLLTAVFATDHSDYSDQCLEQLLRLHPNGIGKLVVVVAHGDNPPASLAEQNEDVAQRLTRIADETDTWMRQGSPNDVIRAAMEELDADLLILGAQGQGFIDRLMMGSVSFFQVVSEPHSVLVLRP